MNHSGRARRALAVVLTAVLLAPGLVSLNAAPVKAAGPPAGFVTRIGTHLLLDGRPFVFTGLDIYNANSDGYCGARMDTGSRLDDALTALGPGPLVIRSWFFQSLAINKGTRLRDWSAFDHTLQVAAAHGFKVIVTLTDQWGECGSDVAGNGYKTADWYVNGYKAIQPGMIDSYRDWVAEVVNKYRGNPTIAFWQLINEAEVTPCPSGDLSPYNTLHDWAADVSGLIKGIDKVHLVSLGTIGSGQCGADDPRYKTLHMISTIDLCEFHDYGAPLVGIPGDQYNGLQHRIDQCNALDKPVFVGESGIKPSDIGGTFKARADAFRVKIDAETGAGVQGVLAWAWSPQDNPASTLNNYDIGPGDPALATLSSPEIAATERSSVDGSGSQANGPSVEFSKSLDVSADGRFVAFQSSATNLVPGDTNGVGDIFIRDRATRTTRRVSVDSAGGQADGESQQVAISSDGHFVAFSSVADNLVAGDTNGLTDVFVRDMSTGATERVSVDSGGLQAIGGTSWQPAISADGGFVAFASAATNLEPGNPSGDYHIYVHDRTTGSTVRVSVGSGGSAPANGSSGGPNISADGRFVTFASAGDNLVPGDTNGTYDVFVRDRQLGTTERVSVDGAGVQGDASSGHSSISADGRFVAFDSSATNLVVGDLNGHVDVFVHDRQTGATERDSVVGGGAEANSDSFDSAISADGQSVVFDSFAGNLVTGDTNGFHEVFVHDQLSAATERLSVDNCNSQADSVSYEAHVNGDGSAVAFASSATNLVGGDGNGASDAFVRTRDPDQPTTGTCPGAPSSVSAGAGDGQASLSWAAAASNGNQLIGYTIYGTSTAGDVTATADYPQTSATVTGLADGATYTFTVTATNGVGTGPVSGQSAAVTPQAGALAPQTASKAIPPSGATTSTDPGSGPTAGDPLTTSVVAPATVGGGSVTIAETALSATPPPGGYQFLGQQVDITSTVQTSSSNPLTIVFTTYPSVLLAATGMSKPPASSVDVTRAETGSPLVIPGCTTLTPQILPDPCVSARQYVGNNLQITIKTSTASHWNTAVQTTAVTVGSSGYGPWNVTVAQGGIVLWDFSPTKAHSVTESLKLGPGKVPLFDSGVLTGGRYGYAFLAAGNYIYNSTVKGDSWTLIGSVSVPIRVTPTTGGTTTPYLVTWSASALSGYVFDVQYRFQRAGAKAWSTYRTWQSGTSASSGSFTPPSGAGTYAFIARLRNSGSGFASLWSSETSITVH